MYIPIPLVVNPEVLLDELENFFLVIELALLALGDAHAMEECFIIRDFFSTVFYLMELALCEILLTGALARGGHSKGARNRVTASCRRRPASAMAPGALGE